jgi:hypothetical protein
MAGFAALLVGIGIIVVIYGLIQRAKVGRVSAPVFPTGQLSQGGAAAAGPSGTAAVEGNVLCQQPLMSPVTGKACLYYSLKVTSFRKEGDKTKENTLRDEKMSAQFAVDDGSGPLFIDAREGGDFEPEEKFNDSRKTGLLGGIVGQDLQFGNLIVPTGALALGTEYRVEERVLPVQQWLYVNGKMSQQGANVLSKPGFPRSLIISHRTRDEVLGKAQTGAKYSLIGGASSVGVGAILGVVSSLLGGGEAVAADTQAAATPVVETAAPAAAPPPVVDQQAAMDPVAASPGAKAPIAKGAPAAKAPAPTGKGTTTEPPKTDAPKTGDTAKTGGTPKPPSGGKTPPPPKEKGKPKK